MKKKLVSLLAGLDKLEVHRLNHDCEIEGITDDTRKVGKNYIFVALKGKHFDAVKYISCVLDKGAAAIVSETEPEKIRLENATYIKVKNVRVALAQLSSAWNDYPSEKLKVIGVTGTDGKTTTASLIAHILNISGIKTGSVTTVSAFIAGKKYETGFHVTNPEPLELHKLLRIMVDKDCTHAVLEVTSHGITQQRIFGINFDLAVLTNITREHLDYHTTFKEYILTKVGFLKTSKTVILNSKDKQFNKIKCALGKDKKVLMFSDVIVHKDLSKCIKKRFPQIYNQFNASAAVSVAKEFGISTDIMCKAIRSFKDVEGRLQKVPNNKGLSVYVDFAHTPNAIENVLSYLARSKKGKLISIVSAEGERDKEKRKLIPEIAIKYSDITILNPIDTRSEDPNKILSEMLRSVSSLRASIIINKLLPDIKEGKKYYVGFTNRAMAINFALHKCAHRGDIVVICGKGHEKSMNVNGVERVWSDYNQVVKNL
jgi:UDP-N-acetylmuramoyl-L-alanyl-D-glutamate--2,6-diaminopimelate ligase